VPIHAIKEQRPDADDQGGHEKEQYRQLPLRGRCLVICRFTIEFEFHRCLRLAGRILLICELKPEFDAVLTEEITQVQRSTAASLAASPSVIRSRS
jgi:hypothetical protein